MRSNTPAPNITCPYTGHKKKCGKLYMNCPKWIHIIGMDKQTGAQVDEFGCADSFEHMLQIEAAQQMREAGAAIESFRNEMVEGNNQFITAISAAASQNRIDTARSED